CGYVAAVSGPPAAITEEHEVTRIEPMLHRDAPDRSGHDHSRDRNHAVGHPYHAVAPSVTQRLRDPFLDASLCRVHVEFHFAAEKVIRVEPAENEICVGDGRLPPGAAVTYPPRARH